MPQLRLRRRSAMDARLLLRRSHRPGLARERSSDDVMCTSKVTPGERNQTKGSNDDCNAAKGGRARSGEARHGTRGVGMMLADLLVATNGETVARGRRSVMCRTSTDHLLRLDERHKPV